MIFKRFTDNLKVLIIKITNLPTISIKCFTMTLHSD